MMHTYKALAATTSYWKPGDNILNAIIKAVQGKVDDGDFVVVSEKAISTALGNIVDETKVKPSLNAKLIARLWMRVCWGYFLSAMLGFGQQLTRNLRQYPLELGSRHKQLALQLAGPLQALMFGSEGGIDGSNLPFAYVSLPLSNAEEMAARIREEIRAKLKKRAYVVIVDTDKTYTLRNFHFTPRPKPMRDIHSLGGVLTYIAARMFRLRKRPTPLAVAGLELSADEALRIANIAENKRGTGSGTTVWKMAARLGVGITDVTWEMLADIRHKPIVIVRKKNEAKRKLKLRPCRRHEVEASA
jgi:F420-0:gamma-glutamyl ligase-like protein